MVLRRLLICMLAVSLAACATTKFENTKTLGPVDKLAGSSVAVYTFLDIRKDFFGKAMLAEVNAQIVERLRERGVTARVVSYRDTNTGMFTMVTGSAYIPIREFIQTQRPDEEKAGDKYRLLIFPSQVVVGASQEFEVNWTLMDTKTDKPVWRSTQTGSRVIWWNNEEAPQTRAADFVNGAVKQMEATGLLNPLPGAPQKAKP